MSKVKILELKKISSTNDYLKDNYLYLPNFICVRANEQTKGRGQYNRTWISKKKQNLTFSLLLKDMPYNQIDTVKSWVNKSIIQLLNVHNIKATFKEPNDIYVDDKKIAGILIETKSGVNRFSYIVIGIGLNVNQKLFNKNFNATSMFLISNKKQKVRQIFLELISIMLDKYY